MGIGQRNNCPFRIPEKKISNTSTEPNQSICLVSAQEANLDSPNITFRESTVYGLMHGNVGLPLVLTVHARMWVREWHSGNLLVSKQVAVRRREGKAGWNGCLPPPPVPLFSLSVVTSPHTLPSFSPLPLYTVLGPIPLHPPTHLRAVCTIRTYYLFFPCSLHIISAYLGNLCVWSCRVAPGYSLSSFFSPFT